MDAEERRVQLSGRGEGIEEWAVAPVVQKREEGDGAHRPYLGLRVHEVVCQLEQVAAVLGDLALGVVEGRRHGDDLA